MMRSGVRESCHMKFIFIAVFTALLVITGVSGQPSESPRLRQITATEFSAAIPDALYAAHLRNGKGSTSAINVLSTVTTHIYWEFEVRFGAGATWQDLYDFYASMETLNTYQLFVPITGRSEGPISANIRIVGTWLAENRPDLSQQATLRFGKYTIGIEA